MTADITPAELAARRDLTDHEQMLDAQGQCVPCKLCGGNAVISDAFDFGAGLGVDAGTTMNFAASGAGMRSMMSAKAASTARFSVGSRLDAAYTTEERVKSMAGKPEK